MERPDKAAGDMDTSAVDSMVRDICSDPLAARDLHDLLAVIAIRNDIEPDERELDRGTRFVIAYIEQVPYMLKVAMTAAANVGLQQEMRQIVDMVLTYWVQDEDIIPDSLGIVGLLDDAYCSLVTLQTVSDHYRLQTGKHLFPDDLTEANKVMRKIIGDPYVHELDHFVSQAITDAGVMEAVKAMASDDKRRSLESRANIWNHGPVGEMPVDDLKGLGLTEDE
jgi:uncharacterized membrane protein YkvA (DUF1232 family)